MNINDLKPGMYVIRSDVRNPKPDRRKADRNFSAAELWPKGKRVCVQADFDHPDSFKIFPVSYYAHLGVNGRIGGGYNHPGFEALVEALDPVEWTHLEWLRAHINNEEFVLEQLLKAGKVTRDDVLLAMKNFEES